jgi:hypothetical protein
MPGFTTRNVPVLQDEKRGGKPPAKGAPGSCWESASVERSSDAGLPGDEGRFRKQCVVVGTQQLDDLRRGRGG